MLLAAHGHAQDFKSSVAPGAYSGTLRDRDVGAIIISLVLQPCTCHPPLLRAHKMAGSVAPCPGHFDSDFDVEIVWASPVDITRDMLFQVDLIRKDVVEAHLTIGQYAFNHGFSLPSFKELDIGYLASTTAHLNGACINGCAALLHASSTSATSQHCAIFSSYDLVQVRGGAPDNEIWQNIGRTSYWHKDIWIIPIHRPDPEVGHWVLCIAHVQTRKLLLFDSLAERDGWMLDVASIMALISKMVPLANRNGYPSQIPVSGWSAHPALVEPIQTNNHDCGLWVLATIAAVLRGFDVTGLAERHMLWFRGYLHHLVLTLSLS